VSAIPLVTVKDLSNRIKETKPARKICISSATLSK